MWSLNIKMPIRTQLKLNEGTGGHWTESKMAFHYCRSSRQECKFQSLLHRLHKKQDQGYGWSLRFVPQPDSCMP